MRTRTQSTPAKALALVLAVSLWVFLLGSPSSAQSDSTITLTHKGTQAEHLAFARSVVKGSLDVINARVQGKPNPDFPNPDPEGPEFDEFLPWTEADVEIASAARIQRGVAIIIQVFYEQLGHEFNITLAGREAEIDTLAPARNRAEQTDIDSDFN